MGWTIRSKRDGIGLGVEGLFVTTPVLVVNCEGGRSGEGGYNSSGVLRGLLCVGDLIGMGH